MYVIDIVNEFTVKNTNLQYGNLNILYLNLFISLDRLQKCLPVVNFIGKHWYHWHTNGKKIYQW